MRQLLTIFFRTPHANAWTVLVALAFAALAEGLGLATFLPVMSIVLGTGETASPAYTLVSSVMASLGLAMTLANLLLVMVAAISAKAALTLLAMYHVGSAVARVSTGLRMRLLVDLMRARWSYFVAQPVGRVANAVSGEATRAGSTYQLTATALTHMLRAAVLIAVAFAISWPAALFAVAVGGTIAFLLSYFVRVSKRAGARQTARTAELVIDVSDALNNIKPLKAMNKQESFSRLFSGRIEKLRKALNKQVLASEARKNLEELMIVVFLAVGLALAVTYGSVPAAALLVVALVLLQTVAAIGAAQAHLEKALAFLPSFVSVQQLIEETEAAREEHVGKRPPRFERTISLRDVTVAHGEEVVLDGIDLDIRKGETVVITGPSGSGKTTIIDLILGLHRARKGEVLLDDVPLDAVDMGAWRSLVGYVPQDLSLFNDTVRANVTLGDTTIPDEEIEAALAEAGALGFVRRLPDGLDTEVGEKGARLSGGQRQRIALARALVFKPQLLVLDEVTSALDHESEAELCRRIAALAGDLTVIAITHRTAIHAIADRIVVLDAGKILREIRRERAPVTA